MNTSKFWYEMLAEGEDIKLEFSIGLRWRIYMMVKSALHNTSALLVSWLLFYTAKTDKTLDPDTVSTLKVIAWLLIIGAIYKVAKKIFLYGYMFKRTNLYVITNRRVIIQTGISTRKVFSVDLDQISDISVSETMAERKWLKTGSIIIRTAGQIDPALLTKRMRGKDGHLMGIALEHVDQPHEAVKIIEKYKK